MFHGRKSRHIHRYRSFQQSLVLEKREKDVIEKKDAKINQIERLSEKKGTSLSSNLCDQQKFIVKIQYLGG